jgi:hypothetical protein
MNHITELLLETPREAKFKRNRNHDLVVYRRFPSESLKLVCKATLFTKQSVQAEMYTFISLGVVTLASSSHDKGHLAEPTQRPLNHNPGGKTCRRTISTVPAKTLVPVASSTKRTLEKNHVDVERGKYTKKKYLKSSHENSRKSFR